MSYSRLEQKLGYRFGDRDILLQSLTHTSYGHEYLQNRSFALRDNERLEFLGDAILDVVVTDLLLEYYPEAHEGQLSKMRAAVVNEKTLAELARSISIHECVRLGKGEAQTGGKHKDSILSCAFEALIAAIYLDGGFEAVYKVVRILYLPFFEDGRDLTELHDFKTRFQEMVQAQWKITPSYHMVRSGGPDHAKVFEVEVRLRGRKIAQASGSSKKQAEQNAARAALDSIEEVEKEVTTVSPPTA